MKQPFEILDKHSFRKTDMRLKLLGYLQKLDKAVSQPELEKKFSQHADRVTLYRILTAFEAKGIIHKIIDAQGVSRYAMCNDTQCTEHHHQDNHVHFNCLRCGDVVCLKSVKIPVIKLPKQFSFTKLTIHMEGTCNKCQK